MLEDVFLLSIVVSINYENLTKNIKKFKFIENEINNLIKILCKSKNVFNVVESIRQSIYRIIHYNINHVYVADLLKKAVSNTCNLSESSMHHLVHIIATFDHYMQDISICKIVHCYEHLLFEIFKIIHYSISYT